MSAAEVVMSTKSVFNKTKLKSILHFSAVAMLFTFPAYGSYDEGDTFRLTGSIKSSYETNVYKLSDSQDPKSVLGSNHKDDFIIRPQASGEFRKEISKQTFFIKTKYFQQNYNYHESLNYVGNDNSIGVDWAANRKFSGRLEYVSQKDLSSFDDYATSKKDMYTVTGPTVNFNYQPNNNYQIFQTVSQSDVEHDLLHELDLKQTSIGAGIALLGKNSNQIGYRYDESQIEYDSNYSGLTATQRGYQQQSNQIFLLYNYSPKLKINTNIGLVDSEYQYNDNVIKSTMSGLVVDYQLTNKTDINFNYNNSTSAPSSTIDASTTKSFGMQAVWKYTQKSKFNINYKRNIKDYLGSQTRQEVVDIYSIDYVWIPIKNWDLYFSIFNQNRDSNVSSYIYKNSGASVNIQYLY